MLKRGMALEAKSIRPRFADGISRAEKDDSCKGGCDKGGPLARMKQQSHKLRAGSAPSFASVRTSLDRQ